MADQERYDADVRGWLEGLAAPPPRLDLDQIVQTGRAQVRRRRYLTAGGVTATVLAAAVAVPATAQVWRSGDGSGPPPLTGGAPAVECDVTELPLPDDLSERGVPDPTTIFVSAIDPTGRFVVAHGSEEQSPVVIRWDGDTPTYLPDMPEMAEARDVNAHGTVAGNGWDGERSYGWVYGEQLVELQPPDGFSMVEVAGINRAGDVVGTAFDGAEWAVLVWPATDRDRPRVLRAPAGREIHAVGITDDGTVVGDDLVDGRGGYRWGADGVGSELPLPDWAWGGSLTDVRGNWAVGSTAKTIPAGPGAPPSAQSAPPDRATPAATAVSGGPVTVVEVPIRWDLTTGTATEVAGYAQASGPGYNGILGEAVAVNAAGDVVIGNLGPAAVLRDARPYLLPVPVPLAAARPVAISDNGTVVGTAVMQPDGPERGQLIWHC